MNRKAVLFTLFLILLLTQGVQAMESPNFSLDWFTPMSTAGGGPVSSTHYTAIVTIGQTVIGASGSSNYRAGLGYWYGLAEQIIVVYHISLPLIIK